MNRPVARKRWYDLGAAALQHVGAGVPDDAYACPECFALFDRSALEDGQLTIEDVPPSSVGGRPMVLTCRSCNNRAGTLVDESASEWHRMRGLLNRPGRTTAVQFAAGVNGTVAVNDDQTLIVGVDPTRSHKPRYDAYIADHAERVREHNLDPLARSPLFSFTLSFRIDHRRLRLSYLRAAYLAAFARWGYFLVANDVFEPVRQQLLEPDKEHIAPIPVALSNPPDPEPVAPRGFAGTVDGLGATIVVTANNFACLLPGNRLDVGWWARLAEIDAPRLDTFDGTEWAWPSEPEHRWDRRP